MDIKAKLVRDVPGDCPNCIEKGIEPVGKVHEVYANFCKACRAVLYLEFRYAMNWPLDAEEMRRLGYV